MGDDFIEHIEDQDRLDRAMSALSEEERTVIEKIRSGMSLTETARVLGIPKQTASSRKERAIKKMRHFEKKFRTIK